ncbi:16S rRNA (cytosine(1402)-N(4))-methyltransferase RsmH [Candidatus Peregrinibacteria bacterium]|nr:16S rRNA (cytosine(1402)-N(4))-methyltransferase RsmH [Candidatus Peregrinibacteria bacterium]MBI3816993.1 16S rRNA (cytosine(1402)-N(4))-methyltransferase RsmH [Candidatus Peregrinibacteria bacterium]
MEKLHHLPVLHHAFMLPSGEGSPTVYSILDPHPGDTVIDLTLGLGGHAAGFLERVGVTGKLIGIDADAENIRLTESRLEPWKHQTHIIHANFRDLASLDLPPADILFADLGLSSPHVDDPARGFTFREDGPLDLRFDRTQGNTAAKLLEDASERLLSTIFREYGELREHRRIASAIVRAIHRDGRDFSTNTSLRSLIEKTFGYRAPQLLPQIFQALRIAVNDELGALASLLEHGPSLLKPGGRMGIISYHSLEDRMVKQKFRALSTGTKDEWTGGIATPASFKLLTKKGVSPSSGEVARNPRSRSAKFRAMTKLKIQETRYKK